jgi:hypothetical protein
MLMYIPRHLHTSFVFYVPRQLLLDIVPIATGSCYVYLRYGNYILVSFHPLPPPLAYFIFQEMLKPEVQYQVI